MKIRRATKSDKEEVLRFCINTFEWGDYIDQVWDLWYLDRSGILLVAEDEENIIPNERRSLVIAVSHVSLCPDKERIWLEGIRVNPNYRRRSVATQLLSKMISYGKEQGAKEASAMVADTNIASQLMMERNGFEVISKWSYYSIDNIPKIVDKVKKPRSKVATLKDTEMIGNYLRRSEVFKSAGETYVNSWRWYPLDLCSSTLTDLIKNEKVLLTGNDPIEGIAIINKDKLWNQKKNNSFQIVYLDAPGVKILEDLITLVINLIHSDNALYDRIQIYSPQTTYVSLALKEVRQEWSEQFLLYRREI